MLKLRFGSVLACFRFPKMQLLQAKKTVFAQEPLLSDKRNNHKTTTFYSHTHQTKKEQYYEKIDFKCFDSSDDILVC